MTKRQKRKRRIEEWVDYRFRPTAWYSSHSAWRYDNPRTRETVYEGSVGIDLAVELVETVKQVKRGKLQVVSDRFPKQWGTGIFNYYTEEGSDERIFRGTVWTSESGVLGLMMLLLAGREVELQATGRLFKYRKAAVRSLGWAVADHPNLEDM